jgi:hypothetical protein
MLPLISLLCCMGYSAVKLILLRPNVPRKDLIPIFYPAPERHSRDLSPGPWCGACPRGIDHSQGQRDAGTLRNYDASSQLAVRCARMAETRKWLVRVILAIFAPPERTIERDELWGQCPKGPWTATSGSAKAAGNPELQASTWPKLWLKPSRCTSGS